MSNDAYLAEIGDPITNAAGSWRLRIEYDVSGNPSPREDSDVNLGTFIAKVSGFDVPQEGPYGALIAEGLDGYRRFGTDRTAQDFRFRTWAMWLRRFHGARCVLPIYSTGPDNRLTAGQLGDEDRDGAAVGLIYTTRARLTELGELELTPEPLAANLRGEVEQYTAWACGEMTCWVIERTADHADDEDAMWTWVDSCHGYYSVEEARDDGAAELTRLAEQAAAEAVSDETEIDELRMAETGGAA